MTATPTSIDHVYSAHAAPSDGPSPAKRPRTDEHDHDVYTDVQDPEVWMSDGNIIIAAVDEIKKERHLFKCYRGQLARRLPALQDMFDAGAIADSASTSGQLSGVPVIRLYDSHDFVRTLSRALLDPCKVPYKWWTNDATQEIANLIHLASKYQADDLRTHFIEMFKAAWPDTLKGWDRRAREFERMWEEGPADLMNLIRWRPDPVTAIQIALKEDIPSVLPSAFYVLNRDYTVAATTPSMSEAWHPGSTLSLRVEELSAESLRQLIQGREWLRCWIPNTVQELADAVCEVAPFVHEADPDLELMCEDAITKWWKRWSPSQKNSLTQDPLTSLKDLESELDSQGQYPLICNACRKVMRKQFTKVRQHVWEDLPIYFNLGPNKCLNDNHNLSPDRL